jgi:hypothetical protein
LGYDQGQFDYCVAFAKTHLVLIISFFPFFHIKQDGKVADYTSILHQGRRVSYWWDDEYGWVNGVIIKPLTKVTTSSIIKWVVKVDFEDGEKETLNFHPGDKRWKVFRRGSEDVELKNSSEPVVKKAACMVNLKTTASQPKDSKPAESSVFSFTPNLKSKLQEISSKLFKRESKRSDSPPDISAVAAKAQAKVASKHAASNAISFSTKPKLTKPSSSLAGVTKIAPQSSVVDSLAKSKGWHQTVEKSAGSVKYAETLKSSSSNATGGSQQRTLMQSLYKNECDKADNFVNYMTAGSKTSGQPASPESSVQSGSDDLDVKIDHRYVCACHRVAVAPISSNQRPLSPFAVGCNGSTQFFPRSCSNNKLNRWTWKK